MTNEVNNVKSFFLSIQVHLSDVWLESCINWCKTEVLGSNYTPKELQSKVYEQWLLFDLRDVDVPVLPPNLSTKQLFTLNGNFCLQLMQIVDISKPKLWQLQKIRNNVSLKNNHQDADSVGTGKRLLQMTLTDGVQEVEAMEYQTISCLSLNLIPGTKIRIMGPVVVRRGRLMLEQQNVKILGGEVEELLVSHAAENVLARWLKLPENPNPTIIEEKLLIAEKEEKNEGYINNFKAKPTAKPVAAIAPIPKLNEEDLQLNREIDILMEAASDHNVPNLNTSVTPDLFEDSDFENIDFNINDDRTSTQVNNKSEKKRSVSLDDDDDIFNNIDIDAHLDEIEKNVPQSCEPVNKPNVITINKLLENMKNISKGVFKIKGKFKNVEEKLTFDEGVYKLIIRIEDTSGDLIVSVHNDVISQLAECTPSDIVILKSDILNKDEAAVGKMMKALMNVKNKLLELDNIMMIQIEKGKLPVITKIL